MNPTQYKPLGTKLKKGGFILTQIAREGDVAIYEQASTRGIGKNYEVIRITRREAGTIMGNPVEAAEIYPGSSSWGTMGWTFQDLDRAQTKMNEILTKQNPPTEGESFEEEPEEEEIEEIPAQ